MIRIAYQVTSVLLLLGALTLPSPSGAATGDTTRALRVDMPRGQVILAQAPSTQAPAPSAQTPAAPGPRADRVEARIKALHDELKITPEQEEQWKQVAQIMRGNAETMAGLIKERAEKAKTTSAVDDLKSYAEITEAHADGLKKFIPAFETLYNSMSDAQKKSADALFRSRGRRSPASKS